MPIIVSIINKVTAILSYSGTGLLFISIGGTGNKFCLIVGIIMTRSQNFIAFELYQYLKFDFVYLMLAMSSEYQNILKRNFECLKKVYISFHKQIY